MKVINLIAKDLDALVYRSTKRLQATNQEILCALHIAERKVTHAIDQEAEEWELMDDEIEWEEDEDDWPEA